MILGGIGVLGGYFYFAYDLPNIRNIQDYRPPVVSEVYGDNGEKLGEFWIECRFLVPINKIPDKVKNAFIASEDARFFEHHGIDIYGIFRAIWEDIKTGHMAQGGSTITQQITRSILLSREKKFARKIREIILATRLERNLNKEQILELYLNQIYLGNRAYGVAAAARNYFHKTLDELTIAEAGMIGGMAQAPGTDSPVANATKAKARQRYVLEHMYDHGFITKAEFETAVNQPLTVYLAGIDKDFNNKYAPYFTEHIRRMLLEKYGEKVVYEGGLKVETTGNLRMNQAAQLAVRHGVEKLDHRQGYRGPVTHLTSAEVQPFLEKTHAQTIQAHAEATAIHIPATADEKNWKAGPSILEPETLYQAVVMGKNGGSFEVQVGHNKGTLKLSGGEGYTYSNGPAGAIQVNDVIYVFKGADDNSFLLTQVPLVQSALVSADPKNGYVKAMVGGYDFMRSEFNRATQSLRQPGSSFKPFIYAAALDKGYTFSTGVTDAPVQYRVGANEYWSPKNYGGGHSGGGTILDNLTYSRNVPTVKIAHDIGLHYLTAYIRKLGLTSPIGKYLSMALGANGVYLNEMIHAYSAFPNHGEQGAQVYILKVTDSTGKVLEEYAPAADVATLDQAVEAQKTHAEDLNSELYDRNKPWIETDKLLLDPQELQVLYGAAIAKGYTITPQTAYLMVRMMRNVVEKGTGTRMLALKRPVAGKTGTTNDEMDTWFIGYTPNHIAGVWVGYDILKRLGSGEQGGRTAAPVVLEYMQEALKDTPVVDFEPPPGFPMAKLMTTPGGSAVYWHGGSKKDGTEIEGDIGSPTRRVRDRGVNFYEEDLN
jgi:penicillin-binding protein 1A